MKVRLSLVVAKTTGLNKLTHDVMMIVNVTILRLGYVSVAILIWKSYVRPPAAVYNASENLNVACGLLYSGGGLQQLHGGGRVYVPRSLDVS